MAGRWWTVGNQSLDAHTDADGRQHNSDEHQKRPHRNSFAPGSESASFPLAYLRSLFGDLGWRRNLGATSRPYTGTVGPVTAPLILLPPSEGKESGGKAKRLPDRFAASLFAERAEVRAALADVLATSNLDRMSKLFRVRGELLDRGLRATQEFLDGSAPLLPAWRRYTGVVWDALEPETLPRATRLRILVPSALYGITTAEDQIVDYRLTMHVALPGLGNLARHWRSPLTEVVKRAAGRSKVVSLLPNEHAAAVGLGQLRNVVSVSFVAADGKRAVGHEAKAAKGRFARHLIDNGIGEAAGFRFEGWTVREAGSGFTLVSPK